MKRRDFLKGLAVASGATWCSLTEAAAAPLEGATPSSPSGSPVITTCNMCFHGCSVVATLEEGQRIRLQGNPASPVNRGKLCAKGNAGFYKATHPERVRQPMIRVGERHSTSGSSTSWSSWPVVARWSGPSRGSSIRT